MGMDGYLGFINLNNAKRAKDAKIAKKTIIELRKPWLMSWPSFPRWRESMFLKYLDACLREHDK